MKTRMGTQTGSTLVELILAFGVIAGLALSICSALSYLQTQTQQVNLKISREHAVMSFLDQIRKNLSVYQTNYNPCSDYNACATQAAASQTAIVNCNQPATVGSTTSTSTNNNIVYWGINGLCTQNQSCPGMMQVNIQPFGSNDPSQRGFFVVNITVCHKQIGNGAPFQYEYLVTSQ